MTLRAAVLFAVLAIATACQSGEERVTREDCAHMREHIAELTVAQGAVTLSDAEKEKQRANLAATGGDGYLDACVKQRSRRYVACATAAMTLEELARCDE